MVLVALLPWIAARFAAATRWDVTVQALGMATTPSRLLLARAAAIAVALFAVALSGAPIVIVMRQIASQPLLGAAYDLLPLLALCGLVSAVATVSMIVCEDVLAGWLLTTAIAGLAAGSGALSGGASPILILVVAGMAPFLLRQADSQLTYLADSRSVVP
jgi:hypothetical protein